jgi:hypothetical protein
MTQMRGPGKSAIKLFIRTCTERKIGLKKVLLTPWAAIMCLRDILADCLRLHPLVTYVKMFVVITKISDSFLSADFYIL